LEKQTFRDKVSAVTLVCFAVKTEAAAFGKLASARPSVRMLVTGMGWDNAARTVRAALARERPQLVLSCGFAGGLNPELAPGTVLYAADAETGLGPVLLAAGARPARFHCVRQAACSVADKRAAWAATGADAVDMESQVIRDLCREQNIPSATVRVILDGALEDLPLDFNLLMTPDQRLDPVKLTLALIKSPAKLSALLRLQRQSSSAAQRLAHVLARAVDRAALFPR
jgi:adenosylhomocysteine nucleosidase